MPTPVIGRTVLTPFNFYSPCSCELHGQWIVGRLFGALPWFRVHLNDVSYLRLAARSEISPTFLFFSWPQLLRYRRSVRPVYILKTNTGGRLLLTLDGNAHFRLRQAIGRQNIRRSDRLAA